MRTPAFGTSMVDRVRENALEPPCPQCGGGLRLTALEMDIPHFGPALLATIQCGGCSFRHTDTILTRQGEPSRFTLAVTAREHRDARVIRSQSGTLRIPELGASQEPGPQSESFLTNVEGVLWRFRDIVESAVALGADAAEAGAVLARIDRLIAGAEPFTLIVEDPTGNSAIVHRDAERVKLAPEEAAALRQGAMIIDPSAIDPT